MIDADSGMLTKVGLADIEPGESPFDIFVIRPESPDPVLYCRRGERISEANLQRLAARSISEVLIRASDLAALRERQMAPGRGISGMAVRFQSVREVRQATFERLFREGSSDAIVAESLEIASAVVDTISSHTRLRFSDLYGLMMHDNGTFTHCMNVCVYSISLAADMGIDDEFELLQIGVGGLLHDIGKRHIARATLNKKGPLTRHERKVMATHPLLGFRELALRDDLIWGALMMVYQHHERVDGRGYPVGCPESEIHPFAKICSVADVFHALTSERPYRDPMPPTAACDYLRGEAGVSLDGEPVAHWVAGFAS